MRQIKWIKYKNKNICSIDYSGLDEFELIKTMKKIEKDLADSKKKNILMLLDVSEIIVSDNILLAFKKTSLVMKEFLCKVAILGLKGIKRLFLDAIITITGLNALPFADEKEAKKWLVEK
jgi:hypothetical protein